MASEMFRSKASDHKKEDRYIESEGQGSYIKIDQLGIAIILNSTPSHIVGCYTDNLAPCIAVVCEGRNGFALIHDTGHISQHSYQTVAKVIDGINKLSFYHSSFYAESEEMDELESFKNKVTDYIKQINTIAGRQFSVYSEEAPIGFVTVKRRKNTGQDKLLIDVENRPEFFLCPMGVFPADETATRCRINVFNQGLSVTKDIEADINFDGRNLYPFPAVKKPEARLHTADAYMAYDLIQAQITAFFEKAKKQGRSAYAAEYIKLPSPTGLLKQSKEHLKESARLVARFARAFNQVQKITAVYREYQWVVPDATKPIYLLPVDNKDNDQLRLILGYFKAHQQDGHIKTINLVLRREYPAQLCLELTLEEPFSLKEVPILSAKLTSKPADHKKAQTAGSKSAAIPEQTPLAEASQGPNTAKNRKKKEKKKQKLQAARTTAASTLASAQPPTVAPGKLSGALFTTPSEKPINAEEPISGSSAAMVNL